MVQERISIQRENAPLQVTSDVKLQFHAIAKWALTLSIIGFVVVTTILVGATLSAFNMGILRGSYGMSPIFVGAGYLIVGVLLLIPTLWLFKFSSKLRTAMKEEDQAAMNGAFSNLKTGMMYSGLGIIGLFVFVLLGSFLA